MNRFAALLDRIILTPQRNGKMALLQSYFRETPDPDRGWAVAAITRDLDVKSVKPAALRDLIEARMDEMLFRLSYDYVGDMAETIALAWPPKPGANRVPPLSEIVETLMQASKPEGLRLVEGWLDALDASGRWALIKLVTGGLRIGVGARLVKTALADYGGKPVTEIEELWHGLEAPYTDLFAWLEGRAEKPATAMLAPFRPAMLAHAIEDKDFENLIPGEHLAEWKWDGVRVQAASEGDIRRLYSRTGDDMSAAFPDLIEALNLNAAIDGELLVYDPTANGFAVRPFSDLQQRLNRKTVSKKLLASHPVFIRAYDLLAFEGEDLRPLPFAERRAKLEAFLTEHAPPRMDLSPLVQFGNWQALAAARAAPPDAAVEGVMIKRKDSPYTPGRPKGEWWKWKRDPYLIDAVLMYAQRGHGKRSSFYSDFTFGVWRQGEDGDEIVPVGKAYFGFTDAELKMLDKYVRDHTTDRFGPVRQVAHGGDEGLVLEIAFEGLNRSSRHKSGVAMRFPRISRIRNDKPAREADRLEHLEALLPD